MRARSRARRTRLSRSSSTRAEPAATARTRSTSPRRRASCSPAAALPVAKHGNRAASSACGSADVLEASGIAIDAGPELARRQLERERFTFLFAPQLPSRDERGRAGPSRTRRAHRVQYPRSARESRAAPRIKSSASRARRISNSSASRSRRLGGRAGAVVHARSGIDEIAGDVATDVYQFASRRAAALDARSARPRHSCARAVRSPAVRPPERRRAACHSRGRTFAAGRCRSRSTPRSCSSSRIARRISQKDSRLARTSLASGAALARLRTHARRRTGVPKETFGERHPRQTLCRQGRVARARRSAREAMPNSSERAERRARRAPSVRARVARGARAGGRSPKSSVRRRRSA